MTKALNKYVLLINLGATLFMVGVIWFVQIVHYPLFASVGTAAFDEYHYAHETLTNLIVRPLMLLEMATALLLMFVRPPTISGWQAGLGLLLVLLIWLATFLFSITLHYALHPEFNAQIHHKLIATNWIRTIAWSLRGVLMLYLTARAIK